MLPQNCPHLLKQLLYAVKVHPVCRRKVLPNRARQPRIRHLVPEEALHLLLGCRHHHRRTVLRLPVDGAEALPKRWPVAWGCSWGRAGAPWGHGGRRPGTACGCSKTWQAGSGKAGRQYVKKHAVCWSVFCWGRGAGVCGGVGAAAEDHLWLQQDTGRQAGRGKAGQDMKHHAEGDFNVSKTQDLAGGWGVAGSVASEQSWQWIAVQAASVRKSGKGR